MAACDEYSSESDCESYVADSFEFTGYGPIGDTDKPKPKKKQTKKSEKKEAEADEAKGEKEVEDLKKCIYKIIKDEKFREFFRAILEIHDVKPPRIPAPEPVAEDNNKDENEDLRCKFNSIRIIDYFNNEAGKIDLAKSRIHIVVYGEVSGQSALKYRTLYRLLSQTYQTDCDSKITHPNKILHAIAKIVLDHNIDFSMFVELHDGDLISFYNCPAETEDLLKTPANEE